MVVHANSSVWILHYVPALQFKDYAQCLFNDLCKYVSKLNSSEVSKQPNWSGQDVIVNWILDGKSV
jgi:hypothetical protein